MDSSSSEFLVSYLRKAAEVVPRMLDSPAAASALSEHLVRAADAFEAETLRSARRLKEALDWKAAYEVAATDRDRQWALATEAMNDAAMWKARARNAEAARRA